MSQTLLLDTQPSRSVDIVMVQNINYNHNYGYLKSMLISKPNSSN